MTPREVEQLTASEYQSMVEYANRHVRAEARRARKGR